MDDLKYDSMGSAKPRSDEEISWDAEFADMEEPKKSGVVGTIGDVVKTIVQLPATIVQLPMALLPEETRKHARAAVLESFLAVRSLVSAAGDGVEGMLGGEGRAARSKAAPFGPEGTWGTRRYSRLSTPPGKAQRIEIQDEVSEAGGGDGSGRHITIDDLGNDGDVEGRGMRAGIDY